ncbi:MAG: metallophosphoesterase [Treponema sp.]|nr:metallophosphoesterase [Treponema sp.]
MNDMTMKDGVRIGVCAVCFLFCAMGFYCALKVCSYDVELPQVSSPFRIALVTDLHSCRYGKNENVLVNALCAASPDVVLLGGDIFDDKLSDANTETFLAAAARQFPCYYVTGNHEWWSGRNGFERKMQILKKYGIRILAGERVEMTVRGQIIVLCGVDDPDCEWQDAPNGTFSEQVDRVSPIDGNEHAVILLSHRPEYAALYAQKGFDLVLTGHAHGGQWRIPGILNGLYAPNQGLFPKYAGGRYLVGTTVMIVSRGLARESTRVPRFYNRPELVIVTVRPASDIP